MEESKQGEGSRAIAFCLSDSMYFNEFATLINELTEEGYCMLVDVDPASEDVPTADELAPAIAWLEANDPAALSDFITWCEEIDPDAGPF